MLKITIELLPHGFANEDKAKIISTGFITNDGTGNERLGNYKATFHNSKLDQLKEAIKANQHSTVKSFARKRHSAWDLLMLALNNRQ